MNTTDKSYSHRQRGNTILYATLIGGLIMALVAVLTGVLAVFAGVFIMVTAGLLFSSMTVEAKGGELSWSFGPGLVRKKIPLNQVVSARAVKTNFLEGWGIHYSRYGWLYNVSGWDAVEITLKSGKHFALGTDEPEALVAILQDHMS